MEGTLQKTLQKAEIRRSDERILRDILQPGTLNRTRTDVSPWHVVRRTRLLQTRESCIPAVCPTKLVCPRSSLLVCPPPQSVPPMTWYLPRYQTGLSPRFCTTHSQSAGVPTNRENNVIICQTQ
jgi:hypothetical protein